MAYDLNGTVEDAKKEAERLYAVAQAVVNDPAAATAEAELRAENYYKINGQYHLGELAKSVKHFEKTIRDAAPKVAALSSAWRTDGEMLVVCSLVPDVRSGQVEIPLMAVQT